MTRLNAKRLLRNCPDDLRKSISETLLKSVDYCVDDYSVEKVTSASISPDGRISGRYETSNKEERNFMTWYGKKPVRNFMKRRGVIGYHHTIEVCNPSSPTGGVLNTLGSIQLHAGCLADYLSEPEKFKEMLSEQLAFPVQKIEVL
jgi:hypothetical protein